MFAKQVRSFEDCFVTRIRLLLSARLRHVIEIFVGGGRLRQQCSIDDMGVMGGKTFALKINLQFVNVPTVGILLLAQSFATHEDLDIPYERMSRSSLKTVSSLSVLSTVKPL